MLHLVQKDSLAKVHFRDFLLSDFVKRKKVNQGYSLRRYARDLDILAPTLSNVLRGKRSLSFYSALKIAEKLKLKEEIKKTFLESVLTDKKRDLKKTKISKIKDSLVIRQPFHDEMISDPLYFSILSFFSLDIPKKNVKSISACFGISEARASAAITKMYSAGLIKMEDGELQRTANIFSSTDGVPSAAVKLAHKNSLQQAIVKLDEIPLEFRDYRSLKVPVNTSVIPSISKEIFLFLERVNKLCMSSKEKNLVYEVAVQFFPQSSLEKVNYEK